MAINPIQVNINNEVSYKKKPYKPYLEATGAVSTDNLVKPLPPQGYLIHDNLGNSIKYFFKDIGYDLKAVKDGFRGTANDHQSGRLNDVGLKLGGIGIATYLATQTTNPKARLMEYIGLGAFLTSMAIFPKLGINLPAKIKHGFDIDKQYVDDQGRKKSVMQDSNYVPYDMYLGEIPEEDLATIGDRMGIPHDIKNRNDVIREQMKKIATQNNTLWMLTAGFATPIMSALLCCGLENYVVGPALEKARSTKYNNLINSMLKTTESMELASELITKNNVSESISKTLNSYIGQELPKEEFDMIYHQLTENLDANLSKSIKNDLANILAKSAANGTKSVVLNGDTIEEIINITKNSIGKQNKNILEKIFIPNPEEIEAIIKIFTNSSDITTGASTSVENIPALKEKLRELFNSRIAKSGIPAEHLDFVEAKRDLIIDNISKSLKAKKSSFVTEESVNEIVNFAKIIGEFKDNQITLAKCKSFKFEHAPETILARSYDKFEKALLKELGFSYKELKKMRESSSYTKEIFDKKLVELCKDENKFKKVMTKLGNIIAEMEINLHGTDADESFVKNLITAIENNYNKTALRLDRLSASSFENTIRALVQEDISRLTTSVSSKGEVFDLLDGLLSNKIKSADANLEEYIRYQSRGVGSSKNAEISRIFERYQGAKNSFNRILHTLDVYKRATNPETFAEVLAGKSPEYREAIIQKVKEALLQATASNHTMKLDLVNNPLFYKDVMNSAWAAEAGAHLGTKQNGVVSEATRVALNETKHGSKINLLERFQHYISKFRNIIANSEVDFTKPNHIIESNVRKDFTRAEKTRMSFFNLVGQTPVDMLKGAANRKYNTQKWVRTVSAICGTVFGVAFLAQLGFGKLKNPQNLQKQVNDEQN